MRNAATVAREATARRILRDRYGASLRKKSRGYEIVRGKEKAHCASIEKVFTTLNFWAGLAAREHLAKVRDHFFKNGGASEEEWQTQMETMLPFDTRVVELA